MRLEQNPNQQTLSVLSTELAREDEPEQAHDSNHIHDNSQRVHERISFNWGIVNHDSHASSQRYA